MSKKTIIVGGVLLLLGGVYLYRRTAPSGGVTPLEAALRRLRALNLRNPYPSGCITVEETGKTFCGSNDPIYEVQG